MNNDRVVTLKGSSYISPMSLRVVDYLETNKFPILKEWQSQFVANTARMGIEIPGPVPQTIAGIYADMICLLRDGDKMKKVLLDRKFPHHISNGCQLKLSYLLELLLSGEEVIRDALFFARVGGEELPANEADRLFEEVNHVFRILTRYHCETFCEDCIKPLTNLNEGLFESCRKLNEKREKAHATK